MKKYFLLSPIFLKDFYKVNHIDQYPAKTTLIFSNLTPRTSRLDTDYAIFFGLKHFLNLMNTMFNKLFFELPKNEIMNVYKIFMKETLGIDKEWEHIAKLHDLGYLPIAIYALPEGTRCPLKVPALIIYNTHPDFYWLTNALETFISCELWSPSTCATIASKYRQILTEYAYKTSDMLDFVDYQAHDFSFRGMKNILAAAVSGAAHLLYFKGTDTIPAIIHLNQFYDAPLNCGTSVPATEHSVMCAGGHESELETFRRLITKTYPSGIVSIVSDTWDLWEVMTGYLPALKSEIMARDGKVIIRPDSGDPADIICGESIPMFTTINMSHPKYKGIIECLWDLFGGTINSKGYKQLDSHIGVIYGDSITLERCESICKRLESKGFASTNMVFGIGSYTYQYNTRDTLGWAIKATYAEIDGKPVNLFKDPVTDDGIKKSATGLLKVVKVHGKHQDRLELREKITWDEFHMPDNELKKVYENGVIYPMDNYEQIKARCR